MLCVPVKVTLHMQQNQFRVCLYHVKIVINVPDLNSASVDVSVVHPRGHSAPKEIAATENEAQLHTLLFKRQATCYCSPRMAVTYVLTRYADFMYCSTLPFS